MINDAIAVMGWTLAFLNWYHWRRSVRFNGRLVALLDKSVVAAHESTQLSQKLLDREIEVMGMVQHATERMKR